VTADNTSFGFCLTSILFWNYHISWVPKTKLFQIVGATAGLFTGLMPFLLPNLQHQITE